MKQKLFIIIFFIIHSSFFTTHAQGVWTWMKGDTTYPTIVYGTQHVYAPTNNPNTSAQNYITDNNGIFWLWGGVADTLTSSYHEELWSFNPINNQWAWHSGTNANLGKGVYGTMGVPCATCQPPTGNAPYMWVDHSNNIWMYYMIDDSLNPSQPGQRREMWMYNTNSNMWTWVRNDTVSNGSISSYIYNNNTIVPNVYYPNLLPLTDFSTERSYSLTWTLQSGELLMSYVGNWYFKYNIATNQWAWVTGYFNSNATNTQQPMGQRFVENHTKTFRDFSNRFGAPAIDDQNRIYHYQEYGGPLLPAGLNDIFCLRRYNPATDMWTWVSGDTIDYNHSHFGTPCIGDVNNYSSYPSFDGFLGTQSKTCKNNLWLYNTSIGGNMMVSINLSNYKMTLHRGDTAVMQGNFPPHYGIKGVADPLNNPTYDGAQAMWADINNNVWILQGNSMWRFTPDFNCMGFFVDTTNKIHPPTDTLMCMGDTIKYVIDTGYKYVQFTPSGTASYDSTTHTVSLYPTTTTNYMLVGIRYSAAGCSRNDTTNFKITVYPSTPFTYNPPVIMPLCIGSSANYTVPSTIKIKSFSPTASITPNIDTSVLNFHPTSTTTYTIVASSVNTNGCTMYDTATFIVTVNPMNNPIVSLPNPDTLFCNSDFTTMAIDSHYTFTLQPPTGISYNTDSTLLQFHPSSNTIYTLTVTTPNPCTVTKTYIFPISLSPAIPTATFGFDPNPVPLSNPQTILRNYSSNATNYTWIYNNNIISTQGSGGMLTLTDTGKFCVTLIACKGTCCDTTTNCGEVIDATEYIALPTAFTPNGDGTNDVLNILYRKVTVEEFAVYNRWGQQVFMSKDVNKGWDGRLDNKELPMDSYYYYIKYMDSKGAQKLLKGDVMLVR